MPVFRYKALSKDGTVFQGNYTASSQTEILTMLHQLNSYPLSVEEERQNPLAIEIKWEPKVKIRDISIFCRQF